MTTKFDLHLYACRIAPESIRKVEALRFRRDEFANNSRCDSTVYHATFRGSLELPDDDLWNELERIFSEDVAFVGGLEEEEFVPSEIIQLNGGSRGAPSFPKPLGMSQPSVGTYKACDIHINISLGKTAPEALKFVEALEMPSFDKPQDDRVHRVFSATCESVESGNTLFKALAAYFSQVPGLVGKMKFERTTRFLRLPDDAPALPLTNDLQLAEWFHQPQTEAP